ncbi:MAG TPA: IS110 family transposase, partial [Myxococcota bacterium]|nr:IS110 family transposase [Myxococcota bacterium]
MGQGNAAERGVVWVGLDVHKETVAVAAADGGEGPRVVATVANDGRQLPRLLRRLREQGELRCAYEAGPCGYEIYRMCEQMDISCIVVAPSLVPRKPGDRVKTDRRDALKLCRSLRSGDLTPIWVPDPEHEAMRDLVRGREDAIVDRLRIRHRIKKMLLRQAIRRPEGMRSWSKRYRAWLSSIEFAYAAQQAVWREYLGTLDEVDARLGRYNEALHEQAQTSSKAYLIAALQILKGIAEVNAVTLVAELGDLMRFARPAQLFSYAGLVPAEYSSGGERHQGHITKAGNRHVRRALTEAAWAYRYPPSFRGRLALQRQGAPQWLVDLSWRAQERLH